MAAAPLQFSEKASYNRHVVQSEKRAFASPGRVGIIVQARMGSRRLPGKVLRKAHGKPMIQYLLESLVHAALGPTVVVTSDEVADDGIANLAKSMGLSCVRGDELDVASRFETAILQYGFDAFVRVCGDSPLLDAELIRRGLTEFSTSDSDLVSNTQPRTFPKGQSVEVVRSKVFLAALPNFSEPEDREHVTRYFYRNPSRFRIRNFESNQQIGQVQLSVDTPEDFSRFESLLAGTSRPHWEYRWSDWVAMGDDSVRKGNGLK